MYTTVLIDLDDTIFDFKKAEAEALCKTLSHFGLTPTPKIAARYSEINDIMWKKLEKGELTREEVKTKRFEVLFRELGVEMSVPDVRNMYESTLASGHIFIEGAEEFLKKLHKKCRLYLVSNGSTKIQEGRIASSGIAGYFEKIFISESVGFNKPSKEYFDFCFARIENFRPEETIILGDSLTSDIKGGNNAKIASCWFNPKGLENHTDSHADFEIRSHQEFIDRVLR